MAEKRYDPCGLTNYDDDKHRREENQPEGPVKGTALMMAAIEKEAVMTTEISNSGESRSTEVGDGKGISEGEGALITAFNGGYNDVNESQKKDVKPEREQK